LIADRPAAVGSKRERAGISVTQFDEIKKLIGIEVRAEIARCGLTSAQRVEAPSPPIRADMATERKSYTFAQKWSALKRCDASSVRQCAEERGIPSRTLTSWGEDRSHIETQVYHGRGHLRKFRPLTKFGDLYRALYVAYLRQGQLQRPFDTSGACLVCRGKSGVRCLGCFTAV
jgi:hypothetical protein